MRLIVCAILGLGATAAYAQPAKPPNNTLSEALQATENSNEAAAASQDRINRLDDSRGTLLDRYRAASWQAQQLAVYAKQLETLLGSQEAERQSLEQQLVEMNRTERELLPLMLRMLTSLEKFVGLDLPFLQSERKDRIASLRRIMADPDAATAEKYRLLLEAYQIEVDYGRSLGTERADVQGREVEILRIGRSALFFLTLDHQTAGAWDVKAKRWQPVDAEYRASIKKGLRVAREVTAPAVLQLPMPTLAGGGR